MLKIHGYLVQTCVLKCCIFFKPVIPIFLSDLCKPEKLCTLRFSASVVLSKRMIKCKIRVLLPDIKETTAYHNLPKWVALGVVSR